MANDELLMQQKQEQLNKEIRVGSTHKASELRRKDRELYNIQSVENDNAVIDSILGNAALEIQDAEKARLSAIKGRNLSTLLLLQEKTTGDSKEMKKVKKAVAAIEVAMSRHKQGDAPFSPADVEDILTMYSKAIFACQDYLVDKSPTYSTGHTRYDQVRLNMIRLHEEAEAFMKAKELLATGVLDGQVLTPHELLVQAKVYDLGNGTGVPEGPVPRQAAFDMRKLALLGLETNCLYSALNGKETPSALIMRLSKSKDKNEKKLAKELPALFANIRSSISEFKEGKVAAKYFLVGQSLLSVSQNVYGQLTLNVGKNYIPLERGCGLLADMLATDIIKNRQVYGKEAGENIIREIVGNLDTRRLNTDKRQIMTDYLVQRTKASSSTFSNFYTNTLAQMITALLRGKNVYIVKYGKQINKPLTENDVVFTEEEGRMINIAETKELLAETGKQENREKIRKQVTLAQKADNPAQPLENKQREEQKTVREWGKRETKIKNLLGDIMFSYETWDADNQVLLPGVRIQTMILKNKEAVAELVADLYRRKGDQRAMINGIVDELPLFALQDNEKIRSFKRELTRTLNKVTDTINAEISKKAFFAFGEALENLEDMEFEEEQKKLVREYEAAKREEENKKSLQKGNAFTNFFRRIGQASVKAAVAVKNKAVDLKDEGVKNVKFIKTNAILRHLTNPEALIAGNPEYGIPGIEEIIKDTEMQKFIDLEQSIDESVEQAAESIQETVSQYAGELFHPQEQAEEELPNPYENGLAENEVKRRKRERIRIGNERLIQRTKDSLTSGESGQGLFIKKVFENYFKGVSTIDKRSMLASMIRNSRPVGKLMDENDPAINPDADGLLEEEINRRREEKRKRHEYNEKLKTEAMAGYLGGLLKGAGPLFQKMMQGLPIDGLPGEIKGAVEDMKSKLAPIPDEIVEAQLNSIVENSHKQIKNIKVIKPLGAASVGQTFLCKLTRSDGTGEEVAIKLLKPDVRNRMMREKKLMINCARETDIESRQNDNARRMQSGLAPLPAFKNNEKGGMQVTYEGQLKRIEEELDLTIEAKNVELGKIYDKAENEKQEKVVSVKVNNLVATTTNSMVLEKAPGETLDSLLKRIKEETKRLKDLYKRENYINDKMTEEQKAHIRQTALTSPYYVSVATICIETGIEKYSKQYEELKPLVIQEKVCKLLAELKLKKAYLEAFAHKWTKEGVFESGFYHGDPHDGNIMISDEKLTVIDFGNCTKLNEDQQVHITKMMAAASIGDMKTFRHGFHMLLKPEFEALYQEKRGELSRIFAEIFSLGDKRSSGARIAVAILEAQKLGLEIPAAVFNFSQGQMRLQNALDNMNRQIEETEAVAELYNEVLEDEEDGFDFTNARRYTEVNASPGLNTASEAYTRDLMIYTDNREDMKSLLMDYPNTIRNVFLGKFADADAAFDSAINGLNQVVQAADVSVYYPNDPQQTAGIIESLKLGIKESVTRGIAGMFDPQIAQDMFDCIRERYITKVADNQKIEDLVARLNEQKTIARSIYTAYDAMDKKMDSIKRNHKGKWSPAETENAEFEVLRDRFLDVYLPLHIKCAFGQDTFIDYINKLMDPEPETREQVGLHMSRFFKKYPEGREEFMLVYNDFVGAQNAGLRQSDPAQYKQKQDALFNAYLKVMAGRLREKEKIFGDAAKKQNADFLDIMTNVVDEEFSKMVKRMGYFDSLVFNWKYKKQEQRDNELKEDNN